eukprot:3725522-Rhodomonas_salina.1
MTLRLQDEQGHRTYSQDRLRQRLVQDGLTFREVDGDGNCWYLALAEHGAATGCTPGLQNRPLL